MKNLPLLLEPEALHALLNSEAKNAVLIVDLGSATRFESAHIPGAVNIEPKSIQSPPPVPGKLPDNETLSQLFRSLGFQGQHVIVYDDEGGGWAGRFIWILDEIGHTNYSYLDGGLGAWQAQGFETESGTYPVAPSSVNVTANGRHTVSAEFIMQELKQPGISIWDARSPEEYRGEKTFAKRAGHIPGAVNYEWTRAMDKSRSLALRPLDTIKQELEELGITPDQHIITHCQTHHRSGLSYLVAKILGFEQVSAYDGSWGEWGNREDTPIESAF